jgi:hypothetical protein
MWTNNTERVSIVSGGNVGIGVTTPNEKLQVAGNIHAFAPSGIDAGLFSSTSAGSTTIAIRSNGVTHFNGGNVGIGTVSPEAKFTLRGTGVADATSTFGVIIDRGTKIAWTNAGQGTTGEYIYSQQSSPFAINIHSGDNDAISCPNTGNVFINHQGGSLGVGTSSPTAKLHVAGTLRVDSSTSFGTEYGAVPNAIIGNIQDEKCLGNPDEWLAINVSGTDYAVPLFSLG